VFHKCAIDSVPRVGGNVGEREIAEGMRDFRYVKRFHSRGGGIFAEWRGIEVSGGYVWSAYYLRH